MVSKLTPERILVKYRSWDLNPGGLTLESTKRSKQQIPPHPNLRMLAGELVLFRVVPHSWG